MEGEDDVKIWVSIRENEKWSAPYSVCVDGEALPHWNPVLFLRENGDIILYFKYGKPIPNWVTYYCVSKDNGKSFSKPQVLVPGDNDGGRGPVKNKAIRLSNGTVVAPASRCSATAFIAAFSIRAIIAGVANTAISPEPSLRAVLSSDTTTLL
jgi:predicted neuraminidase